MRDPTPPPKAASPSLAVYGDTQRITRIYYTFDALILAALLAGIPIVLSAGDTRLAVILAACIPPVVAGYLFTRRKNFEVAAVFMAVVLISMITLIATKSLGIHSIGNLGYPAILIVSSLVTRKRTMVFLTLYTLACLAWLVFGELSGAYSPEVLVHSVPGDFFSAALAIVATAIMVRILSEALMQSNRNLQRELYDRKLAEKRHAYDALHDSLTGLPNRTLLLDRLGQRLELTRRHPQDLFAVLFIDLDRFKVVNDSLGHAVGDELLCATAQRLRQSLRPEDTVSRLSGDEFAVLLNEISGSSDAIRVSERILTNLETGTVLESVNRVSSASIGIAVYNGHYTDPQELLRDADTAMYRAKARGGSSYEIFDSEMYASAMALLEMETALKHGVENQEWQVHYQPILTLTSREITGVEALVRWNHPQRGMVNPDEFIQVAEDTGLILPLGEYVLRTACSQVKAWREQGHPGLWVAVNLSGRQFHDKNLLKLVNQILAETGLPGEGLKLEITESVAMKDIVYTIMVMKHLSDLGIQISLDDFGNGYSSLGYLNRFPLKVLKIDRSFIQDISASKNGEAIAAAIVTLGHTLKLKVVAEGVETEGQLAFLRSILCDEVQGYLFSRPVPTEEIDQLLQKDRL